MTPEEYREILSIAINREVEAYTFYRSVADRVKDTNLKSLFGDLAGEETKHREFLQGLLSKDLGSLHFSAEKDYRIADTLKTPDLSPDLKPIDGIVIAIRKELDAMQMYTQLAGASTDPGQKNMFMELASMERGHKARLEDMYTSMAFPEVW
jgi:rubrerythrin